MAIGIKLSGGGGGGSGGILKVADAVARLALTPTDGMVVLQLDTDELYEYDTTLLAWLKIGGIGPINTFMGYLGPNGDQGSVPGWAYTDSATTYEGAFVNKNLLATVTSLSGIRLQTSVDAGQVISGMNGFQVTTGVGGSVASEATNMTPFAVYSQIGASGTVDNYNGFNDAFSIIPGASVLNFNSYTASPTIDVATLNNYTAFRSTAQIGMTSATALSSSVGVGLYGNFGAFATVTNYQGVQVASNFGVGSSLTTYQGISVSPNVDVTSITSYEGMRISGQFGQTAPTGILGYTEYAAFPNFYTGSSVSNYTGLALGPIFQTGSDADSIQMLNLNPQVDIVALNNVSIFNANMNLGAVSATTLNSYNDANFNPNFGANLSLGDYSGIRVRANVGAGATITGNVQLLDLGINAAIPVAGYAKGLAVDMSNFTSPQQKVGVEINNGALTVGSQVSTADAWFGSATSNSSIGGTFTVAAGSPVTGGAFNFGANLATLLIADDDYPVDGTGLGLGFGVVGYVGQASVATGKTVNDFNMAVAGYSVPVTSTGGTIVNSVMYKAIGALPAGGTLAITNMFGFYAGPGLSLTSPTNVWGISIEDPAAENYFNKSLAIDTATKKVSGAGVGLEIGNAKTLIVDGNIKSKTSLTLEDPGVGTNTVTLQAPTLAANYTYTLPVDYGNNGEALRTNGAGVTSWSTGIELGTVDPFARTQIWNKNTNASLRLGSLGQDGDATDVSSEGSVFYGPNAQGDAMSSVIGDFSYARIKSTRFGIYNSKTNVAGYIYRVDGTSMYLADNAYVKTFETTRTTGITRIAGEVSVNATAVPAASAALDVQGTDGAILFPRLTTAQRNALTAAAGMTVYNTTTSSFDCYTTAWVACGSAMSTNSDLTLTAADSLAISTVVGFQQWRVQGNAAAIAMSTTPFGGTAPLDGTQLTIIGNDDTNTVEFNYNDIAKGYVGPDVVLGKFDSITVQYNAAMDRYVLTGTSL